MSIRLAGRRMCVWSKALRGKHLKRITNACQWQYPNQRTLTGPPEEVVAENEFQHVRQRSCEPSTRVGNKLDTLAARRQDAIRSRRGRRPNMQPAACQMRRKSDAVRVFVGRLRVGAVARKPASAGGDDETTRIGCRPNADGQHSRQSSGERTLAVRWTVAVVCN